MSFYRDVPGVLKECNDRGIHVAAASRTSAVRELVLSLVSPSSLIDQ